MAQVQAQSGVGLLLPALLSLPDEALGPRLDALLAIKKPAARALLFRHLGQIDSERRRSCVRALLASRKEADRALALPGLVGFRAPAFQREILLEILAHEPKDRWRVSAADTLRRDPSSEVSDALRASFGRHAGEALRLLRLILDSSPHRARLSLQKPALNLRPGQRQPLALGDAPKQRLGLRLASPSAARQRHGQLVFEDRNGKELLRRAVGGQSHSILVLETSLPKDGVFVRVESEGSEEWKLIDLVVAPIEDPLAAFSSDLISTQAPYTFLRFSSDWTAQGDGLRLAKGRGRYLFLAPNTRYWGELEIEVVVEEASELRIALEGSDASVLSLPAGRSRQHLLVDFFGQLRGIPSALTFELLKGKGLKLLSLRFLP